MTQICELFDKFENLHNVVTESFESVNEFTKKISTLFSRCRASGSTDVMINLCDVEVNPNRAEQLVLVGEMILQHNFHLKSGGRPLRIAFLGNRILVENSIPDLNMSETETLTLTFKTMPEEAQAWLTNLPDPMNSIPH